MDNDIDKEAIPAEPPVAGNELDTLLGELERVRGYIAWKCGGLDSAGLRATLGPSTMTLGGLLKHLSVCEDHTFSVKLYGRAPHPPWNTVDWDADPDWEWHSAAADSPEQLMSLWQDTVSRSRELVAKAFGDGALDHAAAASRDGRTPSLRRLLIDMIEEYARHVGHADLIRESVDGLVGEDPPGDHHLEDRRGIARRRQRSPLHQRLRQRDDLRLQTVMAHDHRSLL